MSHHYYNNIAGIKVIQLSLPPLLMDTYFANVINISGWRDDRTT